MRQTMLCCGWIDLRSLETLLKMWIQFMPAYHGLEFVFCFRYGRDSDYIFCQVINQSYRFLTFHRQLYPKAVKWPPFS